MTLALEHQVEAKQIVPLAGRVLIRRAVRPEKTEGGIILPETTRQLSQLGEVVNVGTGVTQVKRGDVVVFSIYAAAPIIAATEEQQDLVIVREADIFGLVDQT